MSPDLHDHSSGANPAIEAVIFDMGGVVIRLGSLDDVLAGAGLAPDEIWDRWILSDAVRIYEGGGCDADEFARRLIDDMGLTLGPAELLDRFARFPQGLYPGAVEMLEATNAQVTTAVLSNTNEGHWTTQQDHEIVQGMFDREYLSYALGMVKPDPDIYEYAVADLGVAPSQVLFIDDNQINVDGALACGLQSAVAKGPAEATAVLQRYGVLPSD